MFFFWIFYLNYYRKIICCFWLKNEIMYTFLIRWTTYWFFDKIDFLIIFLTFIKLNNFITIEQIFLHNCFWFKKIISLYYVKYFLLNLIKMIIINFFRFFVINLISWNSTFLISTKMLLINMKILIICKLIKFQKFFR